MGVERRSNHSCDHLLTVRSPCNLRCSASADAVASSANRLDRLPARRRRRASVEASASGDVAAAFSVVAERRGGDRRRSRVARTLVLGVRVLGSAVADLAHRAPAGRDPAGQLGPRQRREPRRAGMFQSAAYAAGAPNGCTIVHKLTIS